MSGYETFVIRLWMETEGGLDHGEVRHLSTGTGFRFRQVEQALEFVQRTIQQVGGRATGSDESTTEGNKITRFSRKDS